MSSPGRLEIPKYARMVGFAEIEKNEFNLNLPRYIDSQTRRGPAGHRGPPAGRHPGRGCRGARPLLGASARSCGRRCSGPTAPATSTWPWTRRRSSPPSSSTRSSPPSSAGMNAHFADWRSGQRGHAQGAAGRLPSQGGHRRPRRGPAGALRRQAADRPLRRLPAPDGLLGRDHAGRLLPDRRRRLEGRDLPHHRDGTSRARRRTRAGPATSCPRR